MPEEVSYDKQAKLIHIRAWGIDTIEDWISSKEQVLQLHEKHGAVRLLFDARKQDTAPSSLDILEFGIAWPHIIQTAILVGEKTRASLYFLETVSVNRAKQMRTFDDIEDALNWLGD